MVADSTFDRPTMPDPAAKNFHVRQEQTGRTLADALRGWLPGKSWSAVQKLLRTRHVQVNGNLCLDAGRRLKPGEVVKLLAHPAAPVPRSEDVRVRHLDMHVIVVEKPAGMTSVRHLEERRWPARRKQLQPTLDEALPQIIARLESHGKKQGGVPPPVRAVHRIDRDTSGLMVFARTVRAERALGQQFRQHTTHRRYLAIVAGQIEAQTIESELIRDRGDGRRGSITEQGAGKRAVTHVKPIERLNGYTLIECRLETGRTHQIRIHLSELGHPLCGDKVYRQPLRGHAIADRSGAPRLALHAAELAFVHPISGEKLQFSMPLPDDLRIFLDRLRQSSGAEKMKRPKK